MKIKNIDYNRCLKESKEEKKRYMELYKYFYNNNSQLKSNQNEFNELKRKCENLDNESKSKDEVILTMKKQICNLLKEKIPQMELPSEGVQLPDSLSLYDNVEELQSKNIELTAIVLYL